MWRLLPILAVLLGCAPLVGTAEAAGEIGILAVVREDSCSMTTPEGHRIAFSGIENDDGTASSSCTFTTVAGNRTQTWNWAAGKLSPPSGRTCGVQGVPVVAGQTDAVLMCQFFPNPAIPAFCVYADARSAVPAQTWNFSAAQCTRIR